MIPSDEESNQKVLLKKLNEKQKEFKKNIVILTDGDQTLCEIDSSSILNKYAQIDGETIKKGFIKHNYAYPGFKKMAEIYSQLKLKDYLEYTQLTALQVDLYPGVSDFIQNAKDFADIYLLTSGHKMIWEKIFQRYNLDITIFSGIHADIDEYIIGRNEKEYICQYFKSLGKIVIALGDSGADTLMLKNADHAVVVVNDERNSDLIPYLTNHPSLFQISFKNYLHKDIPVITFQTLIAKLKELNNSKTRK